MHARWVPVEARTPRSPWSGLARISGGVCRYCRHPIWVPARKGVSKKDALAPPRKPAPAWPKGGIAAAVEQLVAPEGHRLYHAAEWHLPCWEAFAPLATPAAARAKLLAQDPCCRDCRVDLVALAARADRMIEAMVTVAWGRAEARGRIPFALSTWAHRGSRHHPVRLALEAMGFRKADAALAEVDHVRPLWAGGQHEWRNLTLLCQPCHRTKTKREAALRARAKKAHARRRLR